MHHNMFIPMPDLWLLTCRLIKFRQIIFLPKNCLCISKSSQWLKDQLHIVYVSRMKIILLKLWLYRKWSKNDPFPIVQAVNHTMQVYLDTCQNSLWNHWRCVTLHNKALTVFTSCLHCYFVKAFVRVQKLCCNDKIFSFTRSTTVCHLLNAHHWSLSCDGNTLKTFQDSLISISVIVQYNNNTILM